MSGIFLYLYGKFIKQYMNAPNQISYISLMVIIIIGLLFLYLKTYVSQKAKNKALRNENLILTQQIENIKKIHELDIAKRKYQYESKKEQYLKFFQLIDAFTGKQNLTCINKMTPIITEFYAGFLTAIGDESEQNKVSTVYMEKIQNLINENNTELMKIKQETNTIRLIASQEVIGLLDLMERTYENMFDVSGQIINMMPNNIMTNNQIALQKHAEILAEISQLALNIKEDLIQQMRNDLNKI